jgi:hypothetical protein
MWRQSLKDVLFLTETLMARYLRARVIQGSEWLYPAPGVEQTTILRFCMKALL